MATLPSIIISLPPNRPARDNTHRCNISRKVGSACVDSGQTHMCFCRVTNSHCSSSSDTRRHSTKTPQWIQLVSSRVTSTGSLCYKEIWVLPKYGYFPLKPCPKLRTLAIFLLFYHGMLITTSAVNLVRQSQVYHNERPPLFTTRWPWHKALHGLPAAIETRC